MADERFAVGSDVVVRGEGRIGHRRTTVAKRGRKWFEVHGSRERFRIDSGESDCSRGWRSVAVTPEEHVAIEDETKATVTLRGLGIEMYRCKPEVRRRVIELLRPLIDETEKANHG
jgi:hypothetical protein